MSFHPPPPSSIRSPTPAPTLTKTRGRLVSPSKLAKRARSLSFSDTVTVFDSSDDDINEPVTPPPIIHHLSRYVKRAKAKPGPYHQIGPSTFEHRFFDNQLCHNHTMNLEDAQMSNDVLERHLQHLSSEAAAQAVVTMHADVEWRRLCALTTAWEIHAHEQHLKFLHMVLEDEGETYANASSESLRTLVTELTRSSKKEVEDSIGFGVTAYSHDVTLFAVGDAQLDRLESAALTY
ncbi:hypothetical protein F4604DRAFT_1940923 [Suillus subluteus]|nr:hypothetical protein F4604DRAFT_1940923 [Suillus subluteus]